MINEWRTDWGVSDLPFGIVQLPSSQVGRGPRGAVQRVARTCPATVSSSSPATCPGRRQLHPTTKKPVGIRMSIGARGKVYGEGIAYAGPVTSTASASGNKAVVNFTVHGNGLISGDGGADDVPGRRRRQPLPVRHRRDHRPGNDRGRQRPRGGAEEGALHVQRDRELVRQHRHPDRGRDGERDAAAGVAV